jgi:amidase
VRAAEWEGLGALRTLVGMARAYPFTATWNQIGQPVAAVPAGHTAAGLPLSVQLAGPRGEDARLVSLASQIEAERPWADRRPPV